MRKTGVIVYSNSSKETVDYYCEALKKHFAMPLYFEIEMINNQYSILFDPWDGYLVNTSGYVDEIKKYVTKIQKE